MYKNTNMFHYLFGIYAQADRYDMIDKILEYQISYLDNMCVEEMLCLLDASKPYKNELPNRVNFYNEVEKALATQKLDVHLTDFQ